MPDVGSTEIVKARNTQACAVVGGLHDAGVDGDEQLRLPHCHHSLHKAVLHTTHEEQYGYNDLRATKRTMHTHLARSVCCLTVGQSKGIHVGHAGAEPLILTAFPRQTSCCCQLITSLPTFYPTKLEVSRK